MDRGTRLVLYYALGLVGALATFTLAYDAGMSAFENRPRTLLQSFEVVFQTFTTVGYGEDAPWESPIMNLLVIGMQAAGIVLIFAALPVFVIPLIERAVAPTLPRAVDDVENHVLVCPHTPRAEALVAELDSREIPYAIVEPDRETATELYESGYSVVHGDPESISVLRAAGIGKSRGVVADGTDEIAASIVLAAREAAEDVFVVSVADEPDLAAYHRYAGADRVLSPRALLGRSLANRAMTAISTDLEEVLDMDESFSIIEVPVRAGSEVSGKEFADSGLEEAGASVLGIWTDGDFASLPPADVVLDERSSLLALGRDAQLNDLEARTRSRARGTGYDRVLIAGFGEVGRAVAKALSAAGVPWTALDVSEEALAAELRCEEDSGANDASSRESGSDGSRRATPGDPEDRPDREGVVGSAIDPAALRDAGVEDVRTTVLALADDTDTTFGALVCRELGPDVEILARANETENVRKIYRAGADYVLALATVCGRMAAAAILENENAATDTRVGVARANAPGLVGETLADAAVRGRTGVTVIAVERDDEVITGITPEFVPEAGDSFVVVGTDEGIEQFEDIES